MDGEVGPYGAAIIAAVAAVIGGLLTAGSNLVVEALRTRQQRAHQAERDERELRQATRLLLAELAEIKTAIQQTAKSHLTWRNDRPLPAFAWREYRAILAAHLPLYAWRWVEGAYQEANALNWRVAEINRDFDSEGPVHFIDNEWLRGPFRSAHQAMEELEAMLSDPRGVYGYTGYATVEELEEGVWEPKPEVELEQPE